MYFKPRIFLSSTLSNLTAVRHEIKNLLESAGAEVMLYEENLTPSIKSATYRQDVLEADFIIFIFDNRSGTKTEQGISGTNEEWLIVKDTNIPKHVYVKNPSDDQEKQLQDFIKAELFQNMISFYYYDDYDDLLQRIKGTIFSIAKEIAIHKLVSLNVDANLIKLVKAKSDYAKGVQFVKQIEEVINLSNIGMCSLIESTVLQSVVEPWNYDFRMSCFSFIDEKLNDEFTKVLKTFDDFLEIHSKNFTSVPPMRTIEMKRARIDISYWELKASENIDHSAIEEKLNLVLKTYSDFKQLLQQINVSTDIVT